MSAKEPHETTAGSSVPPPQDTNAKEEDWKNLVPYKVQQKDNFKAVLDASCHCGRVKYQLSKKKPLDAKYCHCRTCQKLHGAPFQWAAIFHKEDINFTRGAENLVWYESGDKVVEHRLPCKITCSHCRTPIMDEGRNMILLFPTLINFKREEERKEFDATCHIFYGSRVVDIKDGRPKWSGINDHSELMDEGAVKRDGASSDKGKEAGGDSKIRPTI